MGAALRAAAFSWIEEDIDVGIVAGLTTGIYAGIHAERVRADFLTILREVMNEVVMTSSTPEQDIRVIDYFRAVYYPIPPIFLPVEVQDALHRDASVRAVPEPECARFHYVPFKDLCALVDFSPKQKHTEPGNPSLCGAKRMHSRSGLPAAGESCM